MTLATDFFAKQSYERQRTRRLVLLLLLAVTTVVAVTDLVVTLGVTLLFDAYHLPWLFHPLWMTAILVAMTLSALWRQFQLRGGGESVAKMVGARQLMRHVESLEERRLLNIVDEMAIASGVVVPSVWVMDGEAAINAFAAGYSPNQAVIVVTHGMLTQLSREELQAVIGHEFSHILNGDMRLNVRLIGILAGLAVIGQGGKGGIGLLLAIPAMFLGVIGFFSFKIMDWFGERLKGWRAIIWLPVFFIVASPLMLLMLGLLYVMVMGDILGGKIVLLLSALIVVLGYVGAIFGRLIRAAVSRQREFLADASAVQFTRNPDGLVSALERMRRVDGSLINNALAGEMSHMFFSEAISTLFFENWFATHPSIEERLTRLTGHAPEPLPEKSPETVQSKQRKTRSVPQAAAAGLGVAQPQAKGSTAKTTPLPTGTATPQHMEQAVRLIAAMPPSLRQLINTPQGARTAVYAYLLSPDTQTRAIQAMALSETDDAAVMVNLDDLIARLRELGAAARLPVLCMATPALRQMDQPARDIFLLTVNKLVTADSQVSLDEFVISTILRRQLSPTSSGTDRVQHRDLKSVKADAWLLLASIAGAGGSEPATQINALARGAARLGFSEESPTVARFDAAALSSALDRLRQLKPLKKHDLMLACVETASTDGQLQVAEVELLRSIAMAMDGPLPLTVGNQWPGLEK